MQIRQFEDKGLAHYAYALLDENTKSIILIDPARDVHPYLHYATLNEAKIVGVISTHPHADFISGHLELHQKYGAVLYCSKRLGAAYSHKSFDDGDVIQLGSITLRAINTPGHSPDSICIVGEEGGKDYAVFTGDTLFIGDCGRPDLREKVGNEVGAREELARKMYHSLRDKIKPLADDVLVYPTHGAGSLCGKGLSDANRSTIGAEKLSNWSLAEISEETFVKELIAEQPFVPKYFEYDVTMNKTGVASLEESLSKIHFGKLEESDSTAMLIDTRKEAAFKEKHIKGAINLQDGGKFETWLGSIVAPKTPFVLIAENEEQLEHLIRKVAKIGYETFLQKAVVFDGIGEAMMNTLDFDYFRDHIEAYTVVDIRNYNEVKQQQFFKKTIHIPLPELIERASEIPDDKPIVVHCAAGYRSAAGSSIVQRTLGEKVKVYDLGEAILSF